MLAEDYSQFRKYGNAVITVNDLSREDLIKLQKRGFLRFYMNPRRFVYNLKRAGFRSAMISGMAFLKSIVSHSDRASSPRLMTRICRVSSAFRSALMGLYLPCGLIRAKF